MRLRKREGQRNQQLSDEELQRTQVLNLQDFKETARIERITSKKPAIIAATIGILLIAIGVTFPAMQSLNTRHETQARKAELEKHLQTEVKIVEEDMKCHFENLNQTNGTDENIDVIFHFRDDKLVSSTKNYKLTKSANYQGTPGELASYLSALQSFLMQISGYSVSVQTIENGSVTTTMVDYNLLDISKVPAQHQSNYRFNVLHRANQTKAEVEKSMTAIGYKCEIQKDAE